MFDPQTKQAIDDRLGSFEQVSTGDSTKGPEDAREALWDQWKGLTFELQEHGLSPAAMCESANGIAAVRAEVRSYDETATASGQSGEQPVG